MEGVVVNRSPESMSPKVREASYSTSNKNVSSYEVSIFPNNTQTTVSVNTSKPEFNEYYDDPEFVENMKENQEDDENDNMLTGLISAFLGGLSKPDGSIDIDAIVGLLGSLSTQNPDGTYDFQGLTDLLRGLFGGDGGSDIGAFVGGLVGALLKGVTNPPGAKGAGILTGKIFGAVLPALSGPATTDMKDPMNGGKNPSLDVGGFLSGLLKTLFSGSSGGMDQGVGGTYTFIKTILSALTSIFTASSHKTDP